MGQVVRFSGIYLVALLLVAIVGQDMWRAEDWYALRAMAGIREIQPAPQIALFDVDGYDPSDVRPLRQTVATFLTRVADVSVPERPRRVVLDFWFGSGDRSAETARLLRALRKTSPVVELYATISPHTRSADLDVADRDRAIYELVTKGHTFFGSLDGPDIITYHTCLTYVTTNGISVSVAALPIEVRDMSVASLCPSDDVNVLFIGPDQHFPHRTLHTDGAFLKDSLAGKTVILASLKYDREGQFGNLSNPEVLSWAISGQLSEHPLPKPTVPETSLLFLVICLDITTVVLFLAAFMAVRRLRIGWRLALPWVAASASVVICIGAFLALELFFAHLGVVQPQVTLPAISVLVTGPLCGLWGRGETLEQLRRIRVTSEAIDDYDVFISYAHEDIRWVNKNVYLPLARLALADGRKLRVFFDRDAIKVSSTWQDKIALSIDCSRFVIAIYSDVYFTRPYCIYELRRAYRKWISGGGQTDQIFPIMLGRPVIPRAFDDIQAIRVDDVPSAPSEVIQRIVAVLSSV